MILKKQLKIVGSIPKTQGRHPLYHPPEMASLLLESYVEVEASRAANQAASAGLLGRGAGSAWTWTGGAGACSRGSRPCRGGWGTWTGAPESVWAGGRC